MLTKLDAVELVMTILFAAIAAVGFFGFFWAAAIGCVAMGFDQIVCGL